MTVVCDVYSVSVAGEVCQARLGASGQAAGESFIIAGSYNLTSLSVITKILPSNAAMLRCCPVDLALSRSHSCYHDCGPGEREDLSTFRLYLRRFRKPVGPDSDGQTSFGILMEAAAVVDDG